MSTRSRSGRQLRESQERSEFPVRVKQEPHSEYSSENQSQETIHVKQEPNMDADSERENCVVPNKKYKRVKEIDDDSSSDSDPDSNWRKRKVFKKCKISDSESESESEVSENHSDSGTEREGAVAADSPCEDNDDESISDSSSSSSVKGSIEFESGSEDLGSDKSCSSSESEEVDDDGLTKECLVCRNLGNAKISGRRFQNLASWCRCGHCRIVGYMKDYDRICCREMKDVVEFLDEEMDDASELNMCVTSHPRFEIDVLKFEALVRTKYYRSNFYGNDSPYQAAWSFIRWIWNKIGWGTRMVIPACVSAKIKEKYGPKFQCFTAVTTCERGEHCARSQM